MWFILFGLSLTSTLVPPPATEQPLDELVERIQGYFDRVQDFEARFTQRYVRRILRKTIVEKGFVAVKKPGRMRWDYLSPEEKLFVTDGTKTYFYLPEEKQVIVSHTPTGALGMTPDSPFSLLVGRSRLVEAFEVKTSQSEPQAEGVMLRLVPRRPQEDLEEVELEVGPNDGQVRRVVLVDSQGNRTEFLFEEIRENRDLPDSLFLFTVPSGVDIVLASDSPSTPRFQEPKRP